MTKHYIRPCPVRLIGPDLRNEEIESLTPLYPCAIDADLVSNIWLVRCGCGIEFNCHADKLPGREVTSCGQCVDGAPVQSEIPYLDLSGCSDLLQFG